MSRRKVRVMWMNASRADAHKLDDLYERWEIRSEQAGSSIPISDERRIDYTSPSSIDDARKWRLELTSQIDETQTWLSGFKGSNPYRSIYRDKKERDSRLAELDFIYASLRLVNEYIRVWSEGNKAEIMVEIMKSDNVELALLARSYDLLRWLFTTNNIGWNDLPDDRRATMRAMSNYFNERNVDRNF